MVIFGSLTFFISSYLGLSIAINANKILDITTKMKTGDLSHRIHLYSKDEVKDTANSLNIALDQISELINDVNTTSHTLDSSLIYNITKNPVTYH